MKKTASMISVVGVLIILLSGYGWAQAPVPISPGVADGIGLVISSCPTFSWSEVTEAAGYKLVVFAHETAELQLLYENLATTQTPILVHDIPVRALSWTPSADQGLCAGTYVWYVSAVQWGEVIEWSEGKVFTVDALAGLEAASSKCLGLPADFVSNKNTDTQPEEALIESGETGGALSLEQVILSNAAQENPANPEGDYQTVESLRPMSVDRGMEGTSNTLYGHMAGNSLSTDLNATFIGAFAGNANDAGYSNTFIGQAAGYYNTAGHSNTFVGQRAGYNNNVGHSNTFLGQNAGNANTNSAYNTFLGSFAGQANTSGSHNTFLGSYAGQTNTFGQSNTFIGNYAGSVNLTGIANTFIGTSAGNQNTSGDLNVFIGYRAGGNNETGSNQLYIDNSDSDTPLIYGEFDNDIVRIHGELQMLASASSSDKRLKKRIQPLDGSLMKVLKLQGVSYRWDTEHYPDWGFKNTKQIGLVAQNVEDVLPELVSTDSKGYKAVSYDKLTAVLVEAVKELKAENEGLREFLSKQQEHLENQQSQLDDHKARYDQLMSKLEMIAEGQLMAFKK